MEGSTAASDVAGEQGVRSTVDAPPTETGPSSPQRKRLPAPSTPNSSVRRKMSSTASSSASKEPVPPRRPTTASGTAAVGARRPASSSTTARASTTASKPTASATSRTSTVGSSLNKPPTRPAPGTAARRTALANKTASSDVEPDLSSVTSGDENKKPTVRRASAVPGAAVRSPVTASSRASLAPSTTAAARRPPATRPAAEASTARSTAASRASLASSTRTTAARPTSTRVTPGTAARPSVGTARKAPPQAPEAQDTVSEELLSSVEFSPRSNGPLKDKAASDAEVEHKRSALAPAEASLVKLGEGVQRPGTAPTGPAEMDAETKRRSMEIMQDFFKETTMREKLQEQCNDLGREVSTLQSEKEQLKKQLDDAQAAIVEKDSSSLVENMERKFAQETKQLEEQSHQLEIEKKVVQEKLGAEASRARELQQVLDDLNQELEQQGREWDAEKKQLVEQAGQIKELTEQVATLQKERGAFTAELATSKETATSLQSQLADLQQSHSEDLASKDQKIGELTTTIEDLRLEVSKSKQHSDTLQEAQQKHSEELHLKEQAISEHIKVQSQLRDDMSQLQQRADKASLDLEAERDAHAKSIQEKIEELQKGSEEKLRTKEKEVSEHLASIDDLQQQIVTLQQGSTDGAKVAEDLHKQIQDLKQSHEEALQIKTDENNELTRQLDAFNDQLSSDAAELEQLRDETKGLHKTIHTLEQVSQQEESQHAAAIAKIQAELNAATEKAESYKTELDAVQNKHEQNLRALSEEHESNIQSARSDLEHDAEKRLNELQAKYDSLVAEKSMALEQHERNMSKRADEVETLKKELSILKQSSDIASRDLAHAVEKHEQAEHDKAALQEAHTASMKLVADLQMRVDELEHHAATAESLQAAQAESQTVISNLQARHDALLEEKTAAEDAHKRAIEALKADSDSTSKSLLEEMQTKHEVLSKEFSDLQNTHSEVLADKTRIQESHAKALQSQQAQIEKQYDTVLEAVRRDIAHLEQEKEAALDELVALKKELNAEIEQLRTELGSKDASGAAGLAEATRQYEALLAERNNAENDHQTAITLLKSSLKEDHESALSEMQSKYDALREQITKTDQEHGDAIELLKEEFKAGHSNDIQALQQQLDAIQKQYAELSEQKAAIEKAHEDAISDLMTGMEASTSDAVQQIQKKHDVLVTELEDTRSKHATQLEAAKAAHTSELEATKADMAEQKVLYRDLLSRHDKLTADADAHAQDVKSLMETIHKIETERDRAINATEEAEDRIETMKGEVVRKHLARVEPLEKENAHLHDKIERLEAIIAAGDRIARVAATIGEKRNMNSLAEENEEEGSSSGAEGQIANGPPKDVIGTLAAMQETLNQLSELNNDAIAESSRTAQRLTEQN